MAPPPQRIGLYGGSFDPIHEGHLTVAQVARKNLALDEVYFIPVGQSPLKDHRPYASAKDRLHMLKLACQELGEGYDILTSDLERPVPSYTIDTVQLLQKRFRGAQLFWIMGEDQFSVLPYWHEVGALVLLLEFIVYRRCGITSFSAPLIEGLQAHFLEGSPIDISATNIRSQLAAGKFFGKGLPKSVFQYIQTNKLYGYQPN